MATTLLAPTDHARELLTECGHPELRQLRVLEQNEALILEGRVSRYYLKQLAQEVVRIAAEGRRLINRVRVDD